MPITDYKLFWEQNKECMDLRGSAPRIPVDLQLISDWIMGHMDADYVRYYTDCRYQQETRLACGAITEKELSCAIGPAIDFGVIQDASIYGGEFVCLDKATPVLTGAVREPADIDGLVERMANIDIFNSGLIPRYFEWRGFIKREYGADMTYGASIQGCATMMGQILGITNFLTWIMTEPERIKNLIDCWYETSVRYIDAMRRATGFASAGWFGIYSDLTGLLSPALYADFIQDKERMLYERYAGGPDDIRFYHADYHMLHQLPALKAIGVNRVNIDPDADCESILKLMPDVVIVGQIPPTSVLLYGTPEDVRRCVKRDIDQAGKTRSLIISTAGGINPGTSIENLKAICDAAEEFGYYN